MGVIETLLMTTFLAGVVGTGLGGLIGALLQKDSNRTVSLLQQADRAVGILLQQRADQTAKACAHNAREERCHQQGFNNAHKTPPLSYCLSHEKGFYPLQMITHKHAKRNASAKFYTDNKWRCAIHISRRRTHHGFHPYMPQHISPREALFYKSRKILILFKKQKTSALAEVLVEHRGVSSRRSTRLGQSCPRFSSPNLHSITNFMHRSAPRRMKM